MVVTSAAPDALAAVSLPDRLDFTLPDFTRLSWASDLARSVWEPRIAAIVRAWQEIEWRAVVDGVRSCAVTMATPEDLVARGPVWAEHGLNILPVELTGLGSQPYASTSQPYEPGRPVAFRLVLGRPDDVVRFKRAWDAADQDEIGKLLGYPRCCRELFHAAWVESGMIDTTWPMAVQSAGSTKDERTVVVDGPPEANILWRWMGPRPVSHLPCRFDCDSTVAVASRSIDVGRQHGFAQEMDWLLEILSWPVEWSALHGIAEIKTPILRVSTRTDAGGTRCTVRRNGTAYPAEGATGLSFPYRRWTGTPFTESAAYQRGLRQVLPMVAAGAPPVAELTASAAWQATDNGFASEAAMREAHAPVLLTAARALGSEVADVLDLGCGNGALLAEIAALCPNIVPHGIERESEPIEHARLLRPALAQSILHGDLFESEALWADGQRYSLVLLMPGRLLEAEPEQATRLRARLADRCDRVLVYAYGDWLTRYGTLAELASEAGLVLQGHIATSTYAAAALAMVVSS